MNWLKQLFLRRRRYDELSESIREHLDEKIEDMIDHGMTREEAERKARREFGNVTLIEQRSREVWQWPTLESLWADTKYVLRRLRRAPLFTAIALITLAVAVGANTVIFSVVNGVLLKPLSYPNPDRLIAVDHLSQHAGFKKMGISPSIYFVYREQNTTLADIGAYDGDELDVTGAGTPEHLRVLDVTDGTLPLMGVSPALGRLFTRQDDAPGAAQTVVLTYPYWQQRFGGASSVIGSSITVGGVPREIIGVLPRRFHFLDQKDPSLILPMQWDRATTALGSFNANAIARLKPGVSVQQATADLERLLPVVARTFPPPEGFSVSFFQSLHYRPSLMPLKDEVVGNVQSVLWVLLASTILVLLVACANVANLLVVRVEGRHHEFAIRYAIGGTRKGISADILFESSLIGLAGSLIGLLLALGAMRVIVGLGATNIPRIRDIGITPSVLLFTVAIAVIASLLIGCVPILKSTSSHLMRDLRDGGRGVGDGRRGQGTRKALVMLQVALSVVLLICSGLMIRTFRAMMHVSPGFTSPESVQTFGFYIPETQIPDTSPELVVRMDEAITQKLASIPGVSSVSIGSAVPMDKNSYNNPVFVQNRTYEGSEIPPSRRFNFVTPEFFSTLGTQLLAGRNFIWTDIYEKRPVVVAQVGFTRFEAATPEVDGELNLGVRRANLARETSWVPAVENRGEGVLISFDVEAVTSWLQSADVQKRGIELLHGFRAWQQAHPASKSNFPGLPYIMFHSLSHLLITAVSLECGYSASSIRERIYVGDAGYGILLHTGTPDSEGTLGGLVQVGRKIEQHLRSALELGRLCSNDPVCAQHSPQNTHEERYLMGAACHGCLLIAETSCERFNQYLDRSLVVANVASSGPEFFRDAEL